MIDEKMRGVKVKKIIYKDRSLTLSPSYSKDLKFLLESNCHPVVVG
jgi:hypothetical protein